MPPLNWCFVGRLGIEPRTQGFKIDWVDRYPMVRDTSGYLETLRW
jgi:hypothetical protein